MGIFPRKKLNQNTNDGFDELDFSEFEMEDLDSPQNDRKVSITSRLRTEVGDELRFRRDDARFRREILKQSLPSEYTPVLENYDTISNDVGRLYRDQQKEWEKVRGEVKNAIRPFSAILSKVGFKKLDNWANEAERSGSSEKSEDEMDELKIASILDETFGNYAASQNKANAQIQSARQDIEDKRYTEDRADKQMSAKRQLEGNSYLSGINRELVAQRNYNEQITYQYQRKSIEFQARMLLTQQRQLQVLSTYRKESMEALQGIHKNTGLPDYLKISVEEIARRELTQKIMSGVMSPFSGAGSALTQRIVNKIKGKMTDVWGTLGAGLQAFNEQNRDTAEGGKDVASFWAGMVRSMGIGHVINKGSEKITGMITPKIREQMEKMGLGKYGSNLKALGAQMPGMVNKGLKNGFGNDLLDGIVNFFGLNEAAITGNRQVYNKKDLDLEKAAFLDNKMRLAIVDVIPGWLKKIYEVSYRKLHGKDSADLVWDYHKGSFEDSSKMKHQMMDDIVKKENVINSVEAVDNWLYILDPKQVLSGKTREWIKKWVLKERASSDAMHPLELLNPSLNAPKDVKEELLFIIPHLMRLTDKQIDEIMSAETVTDILKISLKGNKDYNNKITDLSRASEKVRTVSVLDEKAIETLSKTPEGRKFLLEAGVLIHSPDGNALYINPDFEHRVFSTRSRDYKQNGKVKYEDGKLNIEHINEDYDPREEKLKERSKLKYGTMHHSDMLKANTRVNEIRDRMSSGTLAFDGMVIGDDYIITKDNRIITSNNPYYQEELDKLHGNKKFSQLRMSELNPYSGNRFSPFKRRRFAAGGEIPSFAKGGSTPTKTPNLKTGQTHGQPDAENLVKTHGGEFVVSNDATKFNVKLLEAINKYGAPLINADGSINSVYHKLFGYKSVKDFNLKEKAKGVKDSASTIANEQSAVVLKKLTENLSTWKTTNESVVKDIASLADEKIDVSKRLKLALKLWSLHQKEMIKENPLGYGKALSKLGINYASGQFDKWIDIDGTGTNVEIKKQLLKGAKNIGRGTWNFSKDAAADAKRKGRDLLVSGRGKMLDRDRTLMGVNQTLKEVENPRMFNLPIDLYFKGKGRPFVTKIGFKNGDYIDQSTGVIIRNPSQITGTIVDSEGSVVASLADMANAEIVTRSGKPYRLLGLDTGLRQYKSGAEMLANKYSIIAQSEKFKQNLERAKKFRDKFIIDQPIDIFDRDGKLCLTAEGFKDRRYVDKETGNVLWSHNDITGTIIDVKNNNQIVLTPEQLNNGLFNNKGEHVKISKFRKYRNLVFKRSHEVYNQYAAKHVNKVRDKALNWMSSMGEKRVGLNHDDNPIDVYIVGDSEPRITAIQFRSGVVINTKTGKAIKSHSGISGPVAIVGDDSSRIAITSNDLGNLVDSFGNKLELPLMMSATQRFAAYIKEAALPSKKAKQFMNFLKLSKDKRKEVMDGAIAKMKIAYDVYVKGSPQKPALTKIGFEKGEYISAKTGKVIIIPEYIDGEVLDSDGNHILTKTDLEKGLETWDGKKIVMNFDPLNGGLVNNLKAVFSIKKRAARHYIEKVATEFEDIRIIGEKDIILKGIDIKSGKFFRADNGKPVLNYADVLHGVKDSKGRTIISDTDLKTGLETVTGKKLTSLAKMQGIAAKVPNLFRVGSWQWQRDQKKDKKEETKKEDKKEKKESWIGKLVKALMSPLGMGGLIAGLGTILGGIKSTFALGISWLGKTLAAKMAGQAAGGFLGGLANAGGKGAGGLLGKLGWRGKLAAGALAGYGLYKGYNYLDDKMGGDESKFDPANITGYQNKDHAGDDPTMAALNADPNQKPKEESMLGKAWDYGKLGLGAAMFLRPWETTKFLAKTAWGGTKLFAKGVDFAAKQGLKGTASLAGRLATKLPAVGRFAAGAARLSGLAAAGTWSATGAVASGALNVGRLIFTGARLLTPWGLGLTALYYGGKALMKLWNNAKNPWNRFRMAQYGFDHNDSGMVEKIAKIESAAQALITVAGKSVQLKNDEKAMNEIMKVCGLKDEEGKDIEDEKQRIPGFVIWFKERFLRVFASYAQHLKKMLGRPDMIDLQTLDRNQQEELLKGVHFVNIHDSPYLVKASPFKDPNETEMDFNDVDVISRKLRDKISQLPEPPKKKPVPAAVKGKDGMDKPIDVSKKDKPVEEHAVNKAINADKHAEVKAIADKPQKQMDVALKAVKYHAAATQAISKEHMKVMTEATETAQKKTDNIFQRVWKSFNEGMNNFAIAGQGALDKLKRGDLSGAAGAAIGAAGNAAVTFGQTVSDYTGIGKPAGQAGGNAKEAEKNLINTLLQQGVTNPTEIAMFLAQSAEETGDFKRIREKGDDRYLSQYDNNKGLGNLGPGDGARFKGRGYMQLTGRANYAAFSKWAKKDFVSHPELLEQEPWASLSAVWFWKYHPNMTRMGRAAAQRGDIVGNTKAVNGPGMYHLDVRKKNFAKYQQLIGNDVNSYLAKLGGNGGAAPANTSSKVGASGSAPTPASRTNNMPHAAPAATGGLAGGIGGKTQPIGIMKNGANAGSYGIGGVTAASTKTSAPSITPSKNSQDAKHVATNKGGADWDIDKIVSTIAANAGPKSKGLCATYVRRALQAGDLKKQLPAGLGNAHEYEQKLPQYGWVAVGNNISVKPQKGDICVFPRYGAPGSQGSKYGHICIYTGSQWVSDFVQRTMFPTSRNQALPHIIFRARNGISKTGPVTAKPAGVPMGDDGNVLQPAKMSAGNNIGRINNASPSHGSSTSSKVAALNSSNGGVSTTTSGTQTYHQPDQMSGMGETNTILRKQLSVLVEIRDALKGNSNPVSGTTQPKLPDGESQNTNRGVKTSTENAKTTINGRSAPEVQRQAMSAVNPYAINPLTEMPNPISVKKPA